ncbi:hypothetical protein F4781DRAFT_49929 [Annulohypoxylon bovei var. microspora]|nr:hypothetical protein F4781DRAFT_49929 [Annulohypoxylon bovei var. microspora]
MLLSLAGMAIVIAEVQYGAGRHVTYLDPEMIRIGLKLNFIWQPIYLWAIPTAKISIAFFLMRIRPTLVYIRMIQAVILFLLAFTFACFMTLMLQCSNLAAIWDSRVGGRCWSPEAIRGIRYTNSIINVTTDFFFALLPIPIMWNIQTNARAKLSLICVVGVGIFACIAGLLKSLSYLNFGKTDDVLWESTDMTVWCAVELNTGIIAACMPCISPLFKRLYERVARSPPFSKIDSHGLRPFVSRRGSSWRFGAQTRTEISAISRRRSDEESTLENVPNEIIRTTVVKVDRTANEQGEVLGSPKNSPRQAVEVAL